MSKGKPTGTGDSHSRPGYNPMNEGYRPDGTKGYSPAPAPSKIPAPPKGGTAVSRPTGSKK